MTGTKATPILTGLHRVLEHQRTGGLKDERLLERYLAGRDEAAFAALVKRHGPLVLGVCRRLLNNEDDAQDAFQATFLVLAQRAGSIRKHGSVASWLHGVARRVAQKARTCAASRRRRERQAARPDVCVPMDDMTWRELRAVLDEELGRLPESLRAPLVLCYLEGMTRDEAARHLCLSARTLKLRLEHARERLRRRLTRRGLTLPAALLTVLLTQTSASATPLGLAAVTVQAALGKVLVRPQVVALVLAVLRASFLGKLKLTVATLCLLAAIGMGVVADHPAPPSADAAPDVLQVSRPQPKKEPTAESVPPRPNAGHRSADARTQAAIAAGLEWIVHQQIKVPRGSARGAPLRPSHWSLPEGKHEVAATACALLALLEGGHTHKARGVLHPYQRNVDGGLTFLLRSQQIPGHFGEGMYSHALATMALCEAYRRTKDLALKEPAQRALDYTIKSQHDAGGWRYAPKQAGDTSVTAWHILALSCGKQAGLDVPEDVLKRAAGFLDQVVTADGNAYSYTPGAPGTPTMTAAGFMCRLEMETAPKALDAWARQLRQAPPAAGSFFHFFATRALSKRGGREWRAWSAALRKELIQRQDKDGSWPAVGDPFGSVMGHFLITAFAVYNLQSCARNDPLVPLPRRDLKADELGPLYTALDADDFLAARRAQRELLAGPRQAVRFFAKELKPVQPVNHKLIDRLITDLNAREFALRQKASVELERLGANARCSSEGTRRQSHTGSPSSHRAHSGRNGGRGSQT